MSEVNQLNALFVNSSLESNPENCHTKTLMDQSINIMKENEVSVDYLALSEHYFPSVSCSDMSGNGWEDDDWPLIWGKVKAADILIVGTPLCVAEERSICHNLIERLYVMSGELNDDGQSIYFDKVGGCIVSGEIEAVKQASRSIGYALNFLGYTTPPLIDFGWPEGVGLNRSYPDNEDGHYALDDHFTQLNVVVMTWNCMNIARHLKVSKEMAIEGNDREAWKARKRFGLQHSLG